jgi:adenylyltransferase/sulfurtransferase
VQIHAAAPRQLDLADLRARLEPFGRVRANDFLLVFAVDAYELTVFSDGRAIVKGTHDPAVARSVYAKYIGA